MSSFVLHRNLSSALRPIAAKVVADTDTVLRSCKLSSAAQHELEHLAVDEADVVLHVRLQ